MITLNFNINVTGLAQNQFHELKELIIMTNAELTAKLEAMAVQAEKVKAEILAEIASISAGTTTPEQDAAIARIEAVLGDFDVRNPDVVPVE